MKKRNLIVAAMLSAAVLAGCGKNTPPMEAPTTQEQGSTENPTEAQNTENQGTENQGAENQAQEQLVGMANPWRDCTEEEANEAIPRLFKVPEGGKDLGWTMLDDTSEINGEEDWPMVQLNFELEGKNFNARAQITGDDYLDISGMYYDWAVVDDVTLANWGGGNMSGKCYAAVTENAMVHMVTWYDTEIGISYSLSVVAPDLDGLDIQAIAEQMYSPENDVFQGPPLYEDTDFATGLIEQDVADIFFEAYGENAAEISVTVEKIYDEEAMADAPFIELLNIDRNAAAFEVSIEVKPADPTDEEAVMLMTIPDGVLDEESGWIKEVHRVGVLRFTGSDYEVTDLGTGW